MASVYDQLSDGTAYRALRIVDLCTCKCVGLVPSGRVSEDDLLAALNSLRDERGIPTDIPLTCGTGFTSFRNSSYSSTPVHGNKQLEKSGRS